MRFVVSWVATCALLAACGGSDDSPAGGIPGSGDAVKSYLAPANYVSVAQKVLQTHSYVLNVNDLVLGINIMEPETQAKLLHQPLRRFSHFPATVFGEQAVGVAQVQEQPCFGGGKQVLDYNDANNNGVDDAGDSVSLNAQACSLGNVVLHGQASMVLNRLSGDPAGYPYGHAASLGYSNFTLEGPGQRAHSNGKWSVDFSAQSETSEDYLLRTPSLSLSWALGGKDSSYTLQDYEVSLKVRPTPGWELLQIASVSGTLVDSALDGQSLAVKTTQPFERLNSEAYFNRGTVTVTDRSGAQVRATVTSATTVTIDLDADADGTYETSVNKLWSEIY